MSNVDELAFYTGLGITMYAHDGLLTAGLSLFLVGLVCYAIEVSGE